MPCGRKEFGNEVPLNNKQLQANHRVLIAAHITEAHLQPTPAMTLNIDLA